MAGRVVTGGGGELCVRTLEIATKRDNGRSSEANALSGADGAAPDHASIQCAPYLSLVRIWVAGDGSDNHQ
eukprot:6209781-Pleurochrysis_carterae.AAC.2